MSRALVLLALFAAGCTDDTDPPWQLDHDRIIAVRATPPRIAAGERALIDALIGHKGAPVAEQSPDEAAVVSPASLVGALGRDASGWVVTAPDADALAAARVELGLPADAPVPLELGVAYADGALRATKIVWLGAAAANPAMTDIEIDHAPATDAELAITAQADIALSIPLPDERYDVTWLSSCGTMHDFDLPTARLRVEPDDRAAGQLALVVRDADGGPAGACGRSTRTDRTRRARVR
ncbi:MAG TPA: hypothetical protein VFK02_30485 [Kofleriaceae bacterium]|nr:hypothetical protein [Kofleriaceae bacterium]